VRVQRSGFRVRSGSGSGFWGSGVLVLGFSFWGSRSGVLVLGSRSGSGARSQRIPNPESRIPSPKIPRPESRCPIPGSDAVAVAGLVARVFFLVALVDLWVDAARDWWNGDLLPGRRPRGVRGLRSGR